MFSLKDKKTARKIVDKIKRLNINYRFMHVCGTHQDTLVKNGLDILLKECGIIIGQGPGCPVCVTNPREIEEMIILAESGKVVTSFGDMLNVPGRKKSLQGLRTEGCDIRTVYSIEDSVNIARNNKEKEIVFMAVGFETTAPTTASVILANPPENFSILSCHRVIPPALEALLNMGEIKIDGLIEPGHVSAIIGTKPYEFISKKYSVPQVIAGFEPLDVLFAIDMLLQQTKMKTAMLGNEYGRAVAEEGNVRALKLLNHVFDVAAGRWIGLGRLPDSAYSLKEKFREWDAHYKHGVRVEVGRDILPGCQCHLVMIGKIKPDECPRFMKTCKPGSPKGACMVSSEGTCRIWANHGVTL